MESEAAWMESEPAWRKSEAAWMKSEAARMKSEAARMKSEAVRRKSEAARRKPEAEWRAAGAASGDPKRRKRSEPAHRNDADCGAEDAQLQHAALRRGGRRVVAVGLHQPPADGHVLGALGVEPRGRGLSHVPPQRGEEPLDQLAGEVAFAVAQLHHLARGRRQPDTIGRDQIRSGTARYDQARSDTIGYDQARSGVIMHA